MTILTSRLCSNKRQRIADFSTISNVSLKNGYDLQIINQANRLLDRWTNQPTIFWTLNDRDAIPVVISKQADERVSECILIILISITIRTLLLLMKICLVVVVL